MHRFVKLVDDIVSVTPSISHHLSKGLIFPYVDRFEPQGYPLNSLVSKSCEKLPPIALSVDGSAAPVYGNNNMSFADVNSAINRSFFAEFSADLPNEPAVTQKAVLDLDQWGKDGKVAAAKFFKELLCSSKSNSYFRSCPVGSGQTGGGGASAGASGGNGATGNVQWVTGANGGGGSYYWGSAGGGDDDDDPSKHLRQANVTPGHYMDLFQASEDLDQITADLLRDYSLFSELGLVDPVFNTGQHLPVNPSGLRPDDYSDPAPPTPHTPAPMTPHTPAPATPASYSMMSPMSQCGNSGMNFGLPSNYGNMGGAYENVGGASMQSTAVSDLLEISKLMAMPSAPPTTNPVYAAMVLPQQSRSDQRLTGQQVFQLTHPSASNAGANPGPNPPPSPSPQSQTSFALSQPVTQFFGVRSYVNTAQDKKVIKVCVKDHNSPQSYDALRFCFDMYKKYGSQLEKQCTLPIANQGMAKLCPMNIEIDGSMAFSMPSNCEYNK